MLPEYSQGRLCLLQFVPGIRKKISGCLPLRHVIIPGKRHVYAMKVFPVFLVILFIVIIVAGCSTTATSETTVPDLTGTWTGSMTGYINGTGYVSFPNSTMTMVVENQTGRIFWGTMRFTEDNTPHAVRFAGAISRDGKSFTLTNGDGGYDTDCTIVSQNEIELVYTTDTPPFIVTIDSLKRA